MVHSQTIRRILHSSGRKSRVAACKSRLTESHKKDRVKFSEDYNDWRSEWDKVLFTDETCISLGYFGSTRGCMSANGLETLHRITNRLNGMSYRDLLEHEMTNDVLDNHFCDGHFIFQHDNSSIHSSTVVNEWLSKQEFTVLPWPRNSPDLSPIENVWTILKRTLNFNGVNNVNEL
ncbi:unnamed protein product [Larinioides sclopetarius]|uniref:Tc1-like transposase DDE domain-containing protein n=1 Tax=Larinioides sclopetarius TaxID=280406 RepID=A0AAV2A5J3_9ARAC